MILDYTLFKATRVLEASVRLLAECVAVAKRLRGRA